MNVENSSLMFKLALALSATQKYTTERFAKIINAHTATCINSKVLTLLKC